MSCHGTVSQQPHVGKPGRPQVSALCWDLLTRMLQPVPAQRASGAQVLAHPWLTVSMPLELGTLNDRLLQVGRRGVVLSECRHPNADVCGVQRTTFSQLLTAQSATQPHGLRHRA